MELEFDEENPPSRVYDAQLMGRLLGYLRPYMGEAGLAILLIIATSLLQLVGPLATAVALDLFVRAPGAELPGANITPVSRALESWLASSQTEIAPATALAVLAAIYMGALVLSFLVFYLQSYVMQVMGQRVMFDLRRDVFGKFQKLPVSYFDHRPVGRLVTRVTNDVDALNELFTSGLVSIFGDVFLLAGIVGVLFWLNWKLALVTFAILPLLAVITVWFKLRARQSYREVRVRLAAINSFLQEHITGMAVVQLFNRQRAAMMEFDRINDDHRLANVRAIFYYAVYYPAIELVTALGVALILWYGGGRVISGALSIGALVAFLQYAQRFYRPLADLAEKYNILQAAMAASERVFKLLDRDLEIFSPVEGFEPVTVRGELEFEDVDFSYNPGEAVLCGLSFKVMPGETVAIVGHTGAGKSTLASLLQRFYDVDSGAVKVDGVDVREWHLSSLRRAVGIVLQDVSLFAGSIADNIRLGDENIGDDRLHKAARDVHALEFIERLPGGFEALVRERGAGLSLGQKQLVAFARALAFDPPVLILDEATASIDPETERWIQLALERLLVGRTSLVIAHRLSTIRRADRILVLHKGELREEGTHEELLAVRGIYHRLYELQFSEETEAVGA